jgi:hypothetical protein
VVRGSWRQTDYLTSIECQDKESVSSVSPHGTTYNYCNHVQLTCTASVLNMYTHTRILFSLNYTFHSFTISLNAVGNDFN